MKKVQITLEVFVGNEIRPLYSCTFRDYHLVFRKFCVLIKWIVLKVQLHRRSSNTDIRIMKALFSYFYYSLKLYLPTGIYLGVCSR